MTSQISFESTLCRRDASFESIRSCGAVKRLPDSDPCDCHSSCWDTIVRMRHVVSHPGSGPRLQEQIGSAPAPLHLLLLGKALADDGIHRRLDKSRGDPLTGPIALTVVDQAHQVNGTVTATLLPSAVTRALGTFALRGVPDEQMIYSLRGSGELPLCNGPLSVNPPELSSRRQAHASVRGLRRAKHQKARTG